MRLRPIVNGRVRGFRPRPSGSVPRAVRGASLLRISARPAATGIALTTGTMTSGSVVSGKCFLDSFSLFLYRRSRAIFSRRRQAPEPKLRVRYHRAGHRLGARRHGPRRWRGYPITRHDPPGSLSPLTNPSPPNFINAPNRTLPSGATTVCTACYSSLL